MSLVDNGSSMSFLHPSMLNLSLAWTLCVCVCVVGNVLWDVGDIKSYIKTSYSSHETNKMVMVNLGVCPNWSWRWSKWISWDIRQDMSDLSLVIYQCAIPDGLLHSVTLLETYPSQSLWISDVDVLLFHSNLQTPSPIAGVLVKNTHICIKINSAHTNTHQLYAKQSQQLHTHFYTHLILTQINRQTDKHTHRYIFIIFISLHLSFWVNFSQLVLFIHSDFMSNYPFII